MNKKRVIIISAIVLLIILLFSFLIGGGLLKGIQPNLYAFSIINFSGYLFFLMLPVEVLVPYYLAVGYSGIVLALLAVLTGIIAQMLDYSVGYSVSESVIHDLIGKWRYQKAERTIKKYGYMAILLFNFFPLSSPMIILAAGALRFDFKKVMLYSFIGLLSKYLIIIFVYSVFFS